MDDVLECFVCFRADIGIVFRVLACVTLVNCFHNMNRRSLCNFKRQNYDVVRAEDEWKRRDPVSTHEWAWEFG